MGEHFDSEFLTKQGAEVLTPLRTSNVHLMKKDLFSKGILANLLSNQKDQEQMAACSDPSMQDFVSVRRSSFEVLTTELARAREGNATNLKPFSQRFIKGAVLAKSAGAKLLIGSLDEAISESLAKRFGGDYRYMQDAQVVLSGRMIPQFTVEAAGLDPEGMGPVNSGCVRCLEEEGQLLENPRVYLKADKALVDSRIAAHEFKHVQQNMASTCDADCLPRSHIPYQENPVELEALWEETEFLQHYGVLF